MTERAGRQLDDHGLEILERHECVELLDTTSVGRLGLTAGSLPVILPLNFVVDGETIVFCTEPGAKLSAARAGDVVCLEVDDADLMNHEGWSVLVTGRLQEITDPDGLAIARRLPLSPWAPTEAPHYVMLSMALVSGRRLSQVHRTTR